MKLNDKLNKKYTLIAAYVIVTCIIIYCLGLVANSAPFIFKNIMGSFGWLMKVAKPILLGFVFAYLFDPVNDFFENKLKKIKIRNRQLKSTRSLALFTTISLVFVVLVAIISLLVYSVTDQLRLANFDDIVVLANSLMKTFTDFRDSILIQLDKLDIQSSEVSQYVKDAATYILNYLKLAGGSFVASLSNISSYITTFIFSFIIAIYFMIDGKMIIEYLKKVSRALISSKFNKRIERFLEDADSVFSGYIRGQLSDALVMMAVISLTLSVIGVKFGVIIGILAGIQIHPVLVIISLIFGNAIGGLLGMLLAVPVGALIKVLFVRYINHRLEKREEENRITDTIE